MNLDLFSGLALWLLLPLALAWIIACFARFHEEFINQRRRLSTSASGVSSSNHSNSWKQPVPERANSRGYDSPELFREDLWLLRIHGSRRSHAAAIGVGSSADGSLSFDSVKSICALLAKHRGARCDN